MERSTEFPHFECGHDKERTPSAVREALEGEAGNLDPVRDLDSEAALLAGGARIPFRTKFSFLLETAQERNLRSIAMVDQQ